MLNLALKSTNETQQITVQVRKMPKCLQTYCKLYHDSVFTAMTGVSGFNSTEAKRRKEDLR